MRFIIYFIPTIIAIAVMISAYYFQKKQALAKGEVVPTFFNSKLFNYLIAVFITAVFNFIAIFLLLGDR